MLHIIQHFLHQIHVNFLLSAMTLEQNGKRGEVWLQSKIFNLHIEDAHSLHVTLQPNKTDKIYDTTEVKS